MQTETKTYRLGSNEMVNAPGVIRWAINGYHFPKDRKNILNVVTSGWDIPEDVAHRLLMKEIPLKVEGNVVVVES